MGQATPLVARQQLDRALEPGQVGRIATTLVQGQGDHGLLRLGQPCQQRAVELDIQIGDSAAVAGRHRIDPPGLRLEEAGLRGDAQFQVLGGQSRVVDDAQFPEHRHRVLEIRKVELSDQRGFNAQTLVGA